MVIHGIRFRKKNTLNYVISNSSQTPSRCNINFKWEYNRNSLKELQKKSLLKKKTFIKYSMI